MQDPGHSTLGSIVVVVVVTGGWCGLGLGFDNVTTALVLSQQTDPRLQFDVCGIRTEGVSQKAAMMLRRQKPGHLGPGSGVVGLGLVVGVGDTSSLVWKLTIVKGLSQGRSWENTNSFRKPLTKSFVISSK